MKKKIIMISLASILAVSNFTMARAESEPIMNIDQVSIDTSEISRESYNNRVLSYKVISYDDKVTVETLEDDNFDANKMYKLVYNPIDKNSPAETLAIVYEFTKEQYENSSFKDATLYDTIKNDDFVYLIFPNMTLSFKYANSPEDAENYQNLLERAYEAVVPDRLSTENNRVEGLVHNYMFFLPEDMNLLAFNDLYNDTTGAVEKTVFKFSPMNRMEMPSTIMELYVYDRDDYKETDDIVKLKDANGLVFAIKVNEENPYKVELDTARYDEYVKTLTDNDFEYLSGQILLPQISDNTGAGMPPASTNTTDKTKTSFVYINDSKSNIEYVTIGEGRKGVPVRAILEELGYQVSWDGANKKISYTQGKITGDMTIGSLEYNYLKMIKRMDMAPSIVNGSAVVPIEFLGQVLPYSYQIEADGNLYLDTNN